MSVYQNHSKSGDINAIECARVAGKQITFVHLSRNADREKVQQTLESPPLSQTIRASHDDEDGNVLFVCEGNLSTEQLVSRLREQGETLEPPIPEPKKFDPWFWRGTTSIIGQGLQLTAGAFSKDKADSAALIGFATLNMTANASNIIFGAQEKYDDHQLRLVRQQVNNTLFPRLGGSTELPNVANDPMAGRQEEPKSFGQRCYAFGQKYSTSIGEISLRTIGATQLSFPYKNYKAAYSILRQTGSLGEMLEVAKNTNPITYRAGLMTLAGKFISMLASEPDPYNPKPPSTLDQFRQKVAFPLSSVVEMAGAGYMSFDRFANQKITLRGREMADVFGGVGNTVFVGGYMIRLAAPYGTREVDMPKLYAHASNALALLPAEERPQALMDVAVQLKQHFKDKPITLAYIYAGIAEDLHKYHKTAPLSEPEPLLASARDAGPTLPTRTQIAAPVHLDTVQPDLSKQLSSAG